MRRPLELDARGELKLTVGGPRAPQAGADADNLVLKAARALAARIPGLVTGAFQLDKELPVAAGLGGGSADAAAALRLLARANDLPADDPRLYEAARATGADVPVCLDPRPRLMWGIGEKLSAPLNLPKLSAVLVNPGVALATKDVFAGWTRAVDSLPPFDLAAVEKLRTGSNFCRLWRSRRTISKLRRSSLRRRSAICSPRCARLPAAGSPACQDRARHVSEFSTEPPRR